eukprot:TRINITY_DN5205_c0_g2_i4.p1 TRINITY_DN5205_c0_g2~~TRINITY_DN5205_c0_g2_i4.p1  ORF type:complete len:276 (+),score=68.94 TRINITY_DN5205_c0_g2_i4:51-878(+)
MTEYWVSQAKYFCKHCKVWMSDNKHVRQLHENGSNHKFNVRTSLKEAHRKVRDEETAKRDFEKELKEIEHAALQAFVKDVMDGDASAYGIKPKARPSRPLDGPTADVSETMERIAQVKPIVSSLVKDVETSSERSTPRMPSVPPPPSTDAPSLGDAQSADDHETHKHTHPEDEAPDVGKWEVVESLDKMYEIPAEDENQEEEEDEEKNVNDGETADSKAKSKILQHDTQLKKPFEIRQDPIDDNAALLQDEDESIGFKKRKVGSNRAQLRRRIGE